MLRDAFLLAAVAVVAGGSTFLRTPAFLYPPVLPPTPTSYQKPIALPPTFFQQWQPVMVVSLGRADRLPCPTSGFYRHPTNCSRFYRCVDFLGTGRFFNRYVFECPTGHIFSADATTCLLGSCDTSPSISTPHSTQPGGLTPDQPAVTTVQPTTEVPVPSTTEVPVPSTTEIPVPSTTEIPVPSTEIPFPSTTEIPVPSTTEIPVPPTTETPGQPDGSIATELPAEDGESEAGVTEQPGQVVTVTDTTVTTPPTTAPVTDTPTTQACTPLYVQHASYCNVYVLCNDSSQRYVCPTGSAFDQPRQMCRISAADESLCVGKAILQTAFLRTELVDGHLLLPEWFELPPVGVIEPRRPPPNPAALTVLTKATRPLVALPDFQHLGPAAGFLRRPQPPPAFTYFSHRRKRIA